MPAEPNRLNTPKTPVKRGQVRADRNGFTIYVAAPTPTGRWLATYPTLDDEAIIMSSDVIEALYPRVVSE